jgi:large subunit ribosomal protein L1
LKTRLVLPYIVKKKRKLVVIREGLLESVQENCQRTEEVELMTIAEFRQKVEGKKKSRWNFAKVLAHPVSEEAIKPLQKLLKEFAPAKRNGSLTENILEEIEKFQQGEIEVKTDKGGNIHALVGSSEFTPEQLTENYKVIYHKITELRPVG